MPETLRNVACEEYYTERANLGVKKGNSGRVGCKTGLPLAVTAERTSGPVAADKSRCYDSEMKSNGARAYCFAIAGLFLLTNCCIISFSCRYIQKPWASRQQG